VATVRAVKPFLRASLLLVVAVLGAVLVVDQQAGSPSPSPSTGPTAGPAAQRLEAVRTVPSRPDVPGYERDCGSGAACVFGPSWTDDHAGVDGHDGCDTRNNVLQRQLRDIAFRPGTRDCVVVAGTLDDPYTGRLLTFAKRDASAVQIDHLYPLALAWDMGASRWSAQRRVDFANDVARNLLAVDGRANASKGDRPPGEWMPINAAYRCDYVERFLDVALAYDLPVTPADVESMRFTLSTC
jgi:hypothetical protein